MKLIRDKNIRRQIAAVLRVSKKRMQECSKDDLSLTQIDEMSHYLNELRKEANKDAAFHFREELSTAYLSILALMVIFFAMTDKGPASHLSQGNG